MVANSCRTGIGFLKSCFAADYRCPQVRLALGFLRETEPEMQDINAFQLRHNVFFQSAEGVHWLH
ncbi:DUF1198 family protein [Shigella flexneri]